jgi:uncharacterized membrane protein affecting hemolysin expression
MQRLKLILLAIVLEVTYTKVSRRAVFRVLTIYMLVALCFGVYQFKTNNPSRAIEAAELIGAAVGIALFTFVAAGILPLIGWALCRFRERNTMVPLLLWLVFGVILAALEHSGSRMEHEAKLRNSRTSATPAWNAGDTAGSQNSTSPRGK